MTFLSRGLLRVNWCRSGRCKVRVCVKVGMVSIRRLLFSVGEPLYLFGGGEGATALGA